MRLIGIKGVDEDLVSSQLVPVTAERESLESRLSSLRNQQFNRKLYAAAEERVMEYREFIAQGLEGLDAEGKRQTFAAFELRIVVTKGSF